MNAVAKASRHLVVDLRAEPGQAAKRGLDMPARTAEPVVEVEMTECGVEIVAPHQDHHAAAKPDAFRISGRAVDGLGRLDELVGLALIVFGRISWVRRIGGRFGRILSTKVAALGEGASGADQQRQSGCGNATQNRILELKHPSTHKVPDLLPARGTF